MNCLPSWINAFLSEIEASLSGPSETHFKSFVTEHALLTSTLSELSPNQKIFEIRKFTPKYLEAKFGEANKGLALCVESLVTQWGYQNFYKIMSWASGLLKALEEGNFLLAASCCRGLFEQTCHFDFFLQKIQRLRQEMNSLLQAERKNILKGSTFGKKWLVSYQKSQIGIIQYTLKAMRGSDYDWKTWFADALKGAEHLLDDSSQPTSEFERKTHINSCIEAVQKSHKIEMEKYYDVLCDFVHPNFGSNSLVVFTKENLDDYTGIIELSYAPKNVEAAAWFFMVLSQPMHEIITIAVKDIRLAKGAITFFHDLATGDAASLRRILN